MTLPVVRIRTKSTRQALITTHNERRREPMASESTQFTLDESQIPAAWFNVVPSMPTPPSPPIHPGTREPIGPEMLAPLFPMALIGQEVTTDEWVDIPGPVMDVYKTFRPS